MGKTWDSRLVPRASRWSFFFFKKQRGYHFFLSTLGQKTQILFFFVYLSIRLGLVISEHFTLVQFMDFFFLTCQKRMIPIWHPSAFDRTACDKILLRLFDKSSCCKDMALRMNDGQNDWKYLRHTNNQSQYRHLLYAEMKPGPTPEKRNDPLHQNTARVLLLGLLCGIGQLFSDEGKFGMNSGIR